MEKKSIFSIIVIIILLIIAGFLIFNNNSNSSNQVQIENITFSLPDGYSVSNSNETEANITNGFNTIIISKCNNNNIKKQVNYYKNLKEEDNNSVYLTNFTVNNTLIYKSVLVNDTSYVHYWFNYNNETYTIFTWDANKNMDDLFIKLISNIKST